MIGLAFGAVAVMLIASVAVSVEFGKRDGMRKAQIIVLAYAADCAETAVKYADDESATAQTIYWRADGACDALDIVAEKLGRK